MSDASVPRGGGRGPGLTALRTPAPHQVEQDQFEARQPLSLPVDPPDGQTMVSAEPELEEEPISASSVSLEPDLPPGPEPTKAPNLVLSKSFSASASALSSSLRALGDMAPPAGWRRWLRLGPSKKALEAAARKAKLLATFDETLTIAVASPKGSAGKTPTARGIAAAFGAARGGGVVAVDLNELRGTLGQRSVITHDRHIGHLVEAADYLLGHRARTVEIERCMNRQPDSFEWVLTSDPTTTEPMSDEDFTKIHTVLKRFYPILVIDTGNAELASSWRSAAAVADLIVVPMKWRADHIAPASRMLEGMLARGEQVGGRVVIVGTNGVKEADPLARAKALEHFHGLPIVEIPVDPALNGQIIRWNSLSDSTKVAFETLGATLSDLAQAQGVTR